MIIIEEYNSHPKKAGNTVDSAKGSQINEGFACGIMCTNGMVCGLGCGHGTGSTCGTGCS